MQIDPDEDTAATADSVDPIIGDIDMTSFSKSFSLGELSLDLRSSRDVEVDCKLSVQATV